ncbi:hypothetical protein Leryth_024504 [Lithospermum erythrorhizon]|nr:hypothetical protein Leryth_024504 [Lithospermum erythrorhizon]
MPSMAPISRTNNTEQHNLFNGEKPIFKNIRQQIEQQRRALPIASARRRLVEEIRKNDTLIIVGETGSGKTTQLPQYLFDASSTAIV